MEELQPQQSWWKRNWKWVVPVGGCLGLIIMMIVFFGALFFGISSAMDESQASLDAMAKIQTNEAAIDLLGEPIEKDGMGSISVSYVNGDKSIEQSIPVKGPKGTATIYVEGTGDDDAWLFSRMELQTNDTSINLLEEARLID
jgi:hypothetical protein